MQLVNVVKAESFKTMLRGVSRNQALQTPSRPTVTAKIEDLQDAVETIKKLLKGTRPALTTDIWTANDGVGFEVYKLCKKPQ